MNSFLSGLHEKRSQKADLIDATLNRAAEENRDISEVETANVAALAKEIEKLDERIAQVTDIEVRKDAAAELAKKVDGSKVETRQTSPARVTREERTYHPESENSFLKDAFAAQVLGDFDARERISRHQQEEKIEKRDVGQAQTSPDSSSRSSSPTLLRHSHAPDVRSWMSHASTPYLTQASSSRSQK
jgi:hypothetical protein